MSIPFVCVACLKIDFATTNSWRKTKKSFVQCTNPPRSISFNHISGSRSEDSSRSLLLQSQRVRVYVLS